MVLALIFLEGIVSGKRVETHIVSTRYSFPDFRQKTNIINYMYDPAKKIINAGTGCYPAFGTTWLGFPTT